MTGVVIVGAGQAGLQCTASLRDGGYDGAITLLGAEPHLPYQRPPLSKAVLLGKQGVADVALRDAAWFADQRITFHAGTRATAIDRAARRVETTAGMMPYDHLVLATGAHARSMVLPGAGLDGVMTLRSLDDALALKAAIETTENVVVIGGGFIGLEVAAVAARLGRQVAVIEAAPRLMARAVSATVSDAFLALHRAHGVDVRLAARVAAIEGSARVEWVRLADGTRLPAELVLLGVGAAPDTTLAGAAGLPCPNGISVDADMRTPDACVFAIGDIAWHPNPHAGGHIRLESVQGAIDQAKCVASAILGHAQPYAALPWFWSDQFDAKLQIAGYGAGHDQAVTRGDPLGGKFSVFLYRAGRLVAVESVNRAADHMSARRLLTAGRSVPPALAADPSADLKGLAA
jgi:3-phenylpropionate/trans-cinnamate dioxygenase ferredoxin reductase subunit